MTNSHPCRCRDHSAAVQAGFCFFLVRQQLQRIRYAVECCDHAAALRSRVGIDGCCVLGVLESLRQLALIAQDRQQFLRRSLRLLDQQVREDLARHHHEKWIRARIVFEQRRRQALGFRLVPHFVARRPVGHSRVQRIQDHIAAPRLVKLRRVFERRIVHDGRFSALFHLHEDLPDQATIYLRPCPRSSGSASFPAHAGRAPSCPRAATKTRSACAALS